MPRLRYTSPGTASFVSIRLCVTPAMEANITNHVLTIDEMFERQGAKEEATLDDQ